MNSIAVAKSLDIGVPGFTSRGITTKDKLSAVWTHYCHKPYALDWKEAQETGRNKKNRIRRSLLVEFAKYREEELPSVRGVTTRIIDAEGGFANE